MLKGYMASLKAETDETSRRRAVGMDAKRLGLRSFTPLSSQIDGLMRSLPPVLRDRPWSMDDLVGRLQGRYRDRPHAAGVGQALRALGWIRL